MSNFKNPQRVCDGCYGESCISCIYCNISLNYTSVWNSNIFFKYCVLYISAEIQQSKWHLGNPISGGRGRQQSMDQASSGLTGSLPNDVAVRRTTSSNLWDEEVHWTPNNAEKSDSSERWLIIFRKIDHSPNRDLFKTNLYAMCFFVTISSIFCWVSSPYLTLFFLSNHCKYWC